MFISLQEAVGSSAPAAADPQMYGNDASLLRAESLVKETAYDADDSFFAAAMSSEAQPGPSRLVDDFLSQMEESWLEQLFDIDLQHQDQSWEPYGCEKDQPLFPLQAPSENLARLTHTPPQQPALSSDAAEEPVVRQGQTPSRDVAGLVENQDIDSSNWEEVFGTIASMYASHTLSQIMEALREIGFHASRRQYKKKLSKWQAEGRIQTKNIPKKDMQLMVCVEQWREIRLGKKTSFAYHGFPVEEDKMNRFKKRHGKLATDESWPERIPTHIRCTTPLDPASNTPAVNLEATPPNVTDSIMGQSDQSHMLWSQIGEDTFESNQLPNFAADIPDIPTLGNQSPWAQQMNSMDFQASLQIHPKTPTVGQQLKRLMPNDNHSLTSGESSGNDVSFVLLRKLPHVPPFTLDELIKDIKATYSSIVLVENKCIQIAERDKFEPDAGDIQPYDEAQLKALHKLHTTCLHEYHDFFLMTTTPVATPVIKLLPIKYGLAARMWKHAIHSYLEILRRRLPATADFLATFIHSAYQIASVLFETAEPFRYVWTEMLGYISLYGFTVSKVEGSDEESRSWANTAIRWYHMALDLKPDEARNNLNLASIEYDPLRKVGYYTMAKSALIACPLGSTEALSKLLSMNFSSSGVELRFILFQLSLLLDTEASQREKLQSAYAKELQENALTSGPRRHKNALTSGPRRHEIARFMAVANIGGLFVDGPRSAILRVLFKNMTPGIAQESQESQKRRSLHLRAQTGREDPVTTQNCSFLLAKTAFVNTLIAHVTSTHSTRKQPGSSSHIYLHIALAFVWSLCRLHSDDAVVTDILDSIPWQWICDYLNGLNMDYNNSTNVHSSDFPNPYRPRTLPKGHTTQSHEAEPLPEDFLMRGQAWCVSYFPSWWFDAPAVVEERFLETREVAVHRITRIKWLGVQLANTCFEAAVPKTHGSTSATNASFRYRIFYNLFSNRFSLDYGLANLFYG